MACVRTKRSFQKLFAVAFDFMSRIRFGSSQQLSRLGIVQIRALLNLDTEITFLIPLALYSDFPRTCVTPNDF